MTAVEGVLDVARAIADALERGDDGDFDSPPWDNKRQLDRLEAKLVTLVARWPLEGGEESSGPVYEPDFPVSTA